MKPTRASRVVLVGFGAIGSAVLRLLTERGNASTIVAVAVRDVSRLRAGLPGNIPVITDPNQLAMIDADLVVEAAGRESVAPWGRVVLATGKSFAVSSTSAFADPSLLAEFKALAVSHGGQLIIPPGALGGIDALSAASRMGLERVEHRVVKPPRAWLGTEAEKLCDLANLRKSIDFFTGSARDAAARFPQNANVAMISALAGLGPENTQLTLVADPHATGNRHEINASGAFGRMSLLFENAALPENPKSSAMTALSLVRLIENSNSAFVI